MPIYNSPLKQVDTAETRRYAGLAKASFDEKKIQSACLDAQLLADPKGIWQIFDYDASACEVLSSPPFKIEGKKIQQHLEKAQKVVLLAVTIGETIEAQITGQFQEGRYADSLLLDAAATTAVEQAADDMEKTIRQYTAPLGYEMIWRFSPGYGDWKIEVQPEMLRLSEAEKIGMRVTEALMLIPRKSITAIIGLIPSQDKQTEKPSSCQRCTKTDCVARR